MKTVTTLRLIIKYLLLIIIYPDLKKEQSLRSFTYYNSFWRNKKPKNKNRNNTQWSKKVF